MEKNKPKNTYRAGSITATIWENKAKNKEGKEYTYLTVNIERSYKDKEEKWQKTNSMRTNDLPKARLVLEKAYEEMQLTEKEWKNNHLFFPHQQKKGSQTITNLPQ